MTALAGVTDLDRQLAQARPPARNARWWTILGAFVRRDAQIALSYRLPFAMGLVQSTITLAFLFFLSRLVGPRLATLSARGSYFDFAVIGTLLLTVFSTTLVSMSQRLRADQSTGTLEVLFTMPLRPALSVVASAAYQTAYAAAGAVVTLAIAVGLGLRFHVSAWSALVALATLACSLVFFVSLGVVLAAYVVVFKKGETLTGLAMTALSVVGGVYYPVSLLPHGLRVLADLIPFTWMLAVLRQGLLGAEAPVGRLGQLALTDVVAIPVALALFGAALRSAQRRGTLGQY